MSAVVGMFLVSFTCDTRGHKLNFTFNVILINKLPKIAIVLCDLCVPTIGFE